MRLIHLPPLAYLPHTLELLDEVIALLERSLLPARRFERIRADRQNDFILAATLHALNALGAARALRVLAEREMGYAVYSHGRTIFESLVKIKWMGKEKSRATSYLEAEPFSRYALATRRVKMHPVFMTIVAECKNEIAANPQLLKLPGALTASGRPDFAGISKALRMPRLGDMAKAIGMDEEGYLIDSSFPSLSSHGNVVYTRNFATGPNPDGSVDLSLQGNPGMLLAFAARSLPLTGSILEEVAWNVFPDGAIQFEIEKLVKERIDPHVAKLHTAIDLNKS
jgi:hypothetical protein